MGCGRSRTRVSRASYRIGNGTAGNVGADTLILCSDPSVATCTNPLPAIGGTDPETADQIRRRAPQAFMTQERAITMADYERVAEMNAQVENAVATLRWTGSWYTVFITAEPKGEGNLTPSLRKAAEEEHQPLSAGGPGHRAGIAAVRLAADRADRLRRSRLLPQRRRKALSEVLGSRILARRHEGRSSIPTTSPSDKPSI